MIREKILNIFLLINLTALFVLVLYLSWIPHPNISATGFFPEWIANWADDEKNDTIRTGIPFIFLGFIAGIFILYNKLPWIWWIISWLTLLTIVIVAEVGQLFLENRFFDWWDVFWGAVGAFLGLAVSGFILLFPQFRNYER